MAITSYGYPGTVDSIAWANWSEELGSAYGVADKDDWKVSVVVGPDRTVAVATGTGWGRGVLDVNSAAVNLQHATVGSGVRYDTIMAHRNWSTPATTFTIVQGTSTAAVSASRTIGPGVVDDQPLALVKITAGSTVPVIEADLRTFPSKIIGVNDLRALVDPRLGDEAVLPTGLRYRRQLDLSGSPVWVAQGGLIAAGTEGFSVGSGPPAGTPLTVRTVTAVVSTNGAGGCGVGFSPAFPNGVIGYAPSPGDFNYNLTHLTTLLSNCSLGSWNGIAFAEGGGRIANATNIRINLLVIGW